MIPPRRVRTFILLSLILLAFATLATSCNGKPGPAVELTAADDGSTQVLSQGQELVIKLESNQTTGYRWAIDGTTPSQLEQVGEPGYESESDLVGAGGLETWTFKAVASGEGDLDLKYWRSFEPTAAPAGTFGVTVKVE